MPKKKVLSFRAEIKALEGDTGQFEGYGSVFGVKESYSEIVDKGAFAEYLRTRGMPALLWQHNSHAPIGIYTEMREDGYGLYVKGQLNLDVQQGREAYALLKQGALSGLSIGFMTNEDFYNSETQIRHLKKVRLMEVSLVTIPQTKNLRWTALNPHLTTSGISKVFCERQESIARRRRKSSRLMATKDYRHIERAET